MESVVPLAEAADVSKFGGKAANLAALSRAGFLVPAGFAVGLDAFKKDNSLSSQAAHRIEALVHTNQLYAVRSSATSEDSMNASWAGQFETYLNVSAKEVAAKVQACHRSVKARARAYAKSKTDTDNFHVAVVVQEMVAPTYAGLSFTKDPSTGSNMVLIEYIRGLGEPLVHGDVDPERIVWGRSARRIKEQTEQDVPIPYRELVRLSEKVESVFDGVPQDIEWAYDGRQIWLVQTRPITTLQDRGVGKHYLGEPGKLFYWGPSRANPLYMGDFIHAASGFFARTYKDPSLPDAPKTLVLFHGDKVVWLIKAEAFGTFVKDTFRAYESQHKLMADKSYWQSAVGELDGYFAHTKEIDVARVNELLQASWQPTLMAEFSLYGAEAVLHDRLSRFDEKSRQEIWGGMTLPDEPTFMQRIDIELVNTGDPIKMAEKYPWIQDGYYGVVGDAVPYFKKRLKIVQNNVITEVGSQDKRNDIISKHVLKSNEVKALDLTRELSVFMDDRKAWMMRSREYVRQAAQVASSRLGVSLSQTSEIPLESLAKGTNQRHFGSTFLQGKDIELNADDVSLAWDWYVEFRASHAVLKGLVASSGGQHFMNGEVFVAQSPQDAVPDNSILVATSTSPSYVPLMRKARALVTDHGGMMSHAAIVAREFRLPCIVGTKRATKVLKNGDKVVLDLVKGEVNK